MHERHYESVVILNAALEDAQIDNTLNRIEEIIKTNGGEVTDVEKWGRKRLAYPIKKSKSGYYAVYRFKSKPELISDLERMYKLDESIIRFLTSLLTKKDLEHYEKMKEQKEKEAELQESESESQQSESEPEQAEPKEEQQAEESDSAEENTEDTDDKNK
jgi:small subunit ribosomal protein S6